MKQICRRMMHKLSSFGENRAQAARRIAVFIAFLNSVAPASAGLPETIERVKESVVAVGTLMPTRQPQGKFLGTGFAVLDGHHVLTNAHVLPEILETDKNEILAVFRRDGGRGRGHEARIVRMDKEHDVALLEIGGERLPAMKLSETRKVREGEVYAFTGFPIGPALGLNPTTHQGIISAITPITIPVNHSSQLDPSVIRVLEDPYPIYQMDAVAYPGSSGSPVYDPESGVVIAMISMVYVKDRKENMLENPSGITYAIPIAYAIKLLNNGKLKQ